MVQLWNEAAVPNWGSVTTGALLSVGTWSHVAVTFEAPGSFHRAGLDHLPPHADRVKSVSNTSYPACFIPNFKYATRARSL